MSLGQAERQGNLLDDVMRFCGEALPEHSIYSFLHRERDRLFPDEMFADLFDERGRRSVPPSVVAVVMVLQRLEGLSDREAVERYCFDARWRYAAGVGGYDSGGWTSFAHTVLVDMRERLRRSECPNRIFEVALEAAKEAGLIGRKRALDSTPLYDAVTTMDTVTLIRSAIRGLLKAADDALEVELRSVLGSGDDYASAAKPQIDWDDASAREALIDERAKDAFACLALLDGRELDPAVAEAMVLLATVVGQDIEEGDDGVVRIARQVAKDRVISTVDPEARHGRKTQARSFDGYKGHAAVDPDSEIITATTVTPGNAGDASVAEDLIADLLDDDGSDATGAPARTTSSRTTPMRTPPSARPSTATTPMARGRFSSDSRTPGSTRVARPSPPPRPARCSPRTASPSTWRTTASHARTRSPSGSHITAAAEDWPTSATLAPPAHCARSAPPPPPGALSRSTPTRRRWPGPGRDKRIAWRTTTGPRVRRWSANSPTS